MMTVASLAEARTVRLISRSNAGSSEQTDWGKQPLRPVCLCGEATGRSTIFLCSDEGYEAETERAKTCDRTERSSGLFQWVPFVDLTR
ncbi:unnamed protein product [Hapterophycus canaliculatus]